MVKTSYTVLFCYYLYTFFIAEQIQNWVWLYKKEREEIKYLHVTRLVDVTASLANNIIILLVYNSMVMIIGKATWCWLHSMKKM